jgi:Inorganic Pyrophosphatase
MTNNEEKDALSARLSDQLGYEVVNEDAERSDAFPTYKTRVKTPAGTLGITHQPGDKRFGRPMMANYGHLQGTYGQAEDGKAWDFYLGDEPDNENLYEVLQTTPDGMPDERKFITHCRDRDHAREVFVSHAGRDRLGYIRPVGWDFFG